MSGNEMTYEQFLKFWEHMIGEVDLPSGKRQVILVPLHHGEIVQDEEGEDAYEFEIYDVKSLRRVNTITGDLDDKILNWIIPCWEGDSSN